MVRGHEFLLNQMYWTQSLKLDQKESSTKCPHYSTQAMLKTQTKSYRTKTPPTKLEPTKTQMNYCEKNRTKNQDPQALTESNMKSHKLE